MAVNPALLQNTLFARMMQQRAMQNQAEVQERRYQEERGLQQEDIQRQRKVQDAEMMGQALDRMSQADEQTFQRNYKAAELASKQAAIQGKPQPKFDQAAFSQAGDIGGRAGEIELAGQISAAEAANRKMGQTDTELEETERHNRAMEEAKKAYYDWRVASGATGKPGKTPLERFIALANSEPSFAEANTPGANSRLVGLALNYALLDAKSRNSLASAGITPERLGFKGIMPIGNTAPDKPSYVLPPKGGVRASARGGASGIPAPTPTPVPQPTGSPTPTEIVQEEQAVDGEKLPQKLVDKLSEYWGNNSAQMQKFMASSREEQMEILQILTEEGFF